MSDLVVEVCDLQIKIKNKVILQDVNLTVEKGAFHGVIDQTAPGKQPYSPPFRVFAPPQREALGC